ncbi:hypothetical protein AALB47_18820 [Lachnospiraceae bacterium 54-11]
MDYQELVRKRDAYQEGKHLIPELTIASYERAFVVVKLFCNAYG